MKMIKQWQILKILNFFSKKSIFKHFMSMHFQYKVVTLSSSYIPIFYAMMLNIKELNINIVPSQKNG